jgi:hypothetical protein
MTEDQLSRWERLSSSQQAEFAEYRDLGMSIDAALNLAVQKQTGHSVTR